MRRIIVLIAAVIVGNITLSAQIDFKSIIINDPDINRNQDLMTVNMDLDFSKFDVNSNRAILLTPYIVKGEESVALPALGFYGRDRYFYYIRNEKQITDSEIRDAYMESEIPEYIPYLASVPFEKWMTGADLVIERKVFGCCGKLEEEDYCMLDRYKVYVPQYIYVKPPKPEIRKERFIEGNAYVDYPVSETDIYPDYHNNTVELAKIRSTIDSVKFDQDVSVTSIFIKGFASPESMYDNNTRLAKGRTQSIKDYVLNMYSFDNQVINTDYEPENWEGLREYLVSSSLPYKNQILKLIDSDIEPDRKEWLIKSQYQSDYKFLLENCYPYLRRTYYRIDYVVRPFTEGDVDHIRELVSTRPQNLSLQEFYLAAQDLDPESEEFQEIFDVAVRMYPEDEIANLNAANVAMQRGDLKSAEKYLARSGNSAEAIYARGVYRVLNEEYDEAKGFFMVASSMGLSDVDAQLKEISLLCNN